MYSDKLNVNILTALLVQFGVKHIVVCPGSRNAPLVHNFNECPDIVCHPVTDERSAGFMALGLRQTLHEPVAVCVTSGSALLNVLPAAAEATYQHQGIIVISADRPQEWIDQLDGQTLPQPGALSSFVGKCVQLPEVSNALTNSPTQELKNLRTQELKNLRTQELNNLRTQELNNLRTHTLKNSHTYCNRLINEALIANTTGDCPSVHINVPITEPLFEFNTPELPCERKIDVQHDCRDVITDVLKHSKRPLIVVGQLPYSEHTYKCMREIILKYALLAEPLSSAFNTLSDQCLYIINKEYEQYAPDAVIYIGGHTVSKRLRQFLRQLPDYCSIYMVNPSARVEDVSTHMTTLLLTDAESALTAIALQAIISSPSDYCMRWQSLRDLVVDRHNAYQPAYSQMLAVKLFEERLESCTPLTHYANSMSIRLAAIYAQHYVYCNRGLNGIEGSLSVAAGQSLATTRNVFCVIGDLSFFYDQNALWQQQLRGNFRILLLNNSIGGIFRNLKGLEHSPARDTLVAGQHHYTAEGICQQFGINYRQATDEQTLRDGIEWLCNDSSTTQHSEHTSEQRDDILSDRPQLLEVITDIDIDEQVFKNYYHSII